MIINNSRKRHGLLACLWFVERLIVDDEQVRLMCKPYRAEKDFL